MTLPYRDCACFTLPIPIYRVVKVGRVRARKITTQGACELSAGTARPIPIYRVVKVGRVRAKEITTQGTCELAVGPADQFHFVGLSRSGGLGKGR